MLSWISRVSNNWRLFCMDNTCTNTSISYIPLYDLIDDVMAWKCDKIALGSWVTLGQVGQVPNLPHEILTIELHHVLFYFPGFPISQGGLVYDDITWIAVAGPCLSFIYHIFHQYQINLDEVSCQTKMRKITIVLRVYGKCPPFP